MNLPNSVEVVEVGMRDGLQMESVFIDTETKADLINSLMNAGVLHLEATSFVSPRAVPQLADASELLSKLQRRPGSTISVLAPNIKGVERAIAAAADEVVVFVSSTESHNQKNLNRSIARSLDDIAAISDYLEDKNIAKKGAIACAFGCPFEGELPPQAINNIAAHYYRLGFRALTLGDTTGMATPRLVTQTVSELRAAFPDMKLSLHFHNTRGLGLVNVMAGLYAGVDSFESSIGGLGGCPFAPGASGNISTEDLVYLLDEMGIHTGIKLEPLIEVAQRMESILGRSLAGQVMKAGPRLTLHKLQDTMSAIG